MRQFSKARRRLATGAFLIVAGPVALGSVAYACQSLRTMHANPGTARAGDTITVFGKNYSSSASNSNIDIRLDRRDGRIIATFSPRSVLNNEPVTIPADVAVGQHTLLATQFNPATGNELSGGPGRATITITAAARTASEGSAASAAAATSSDPVAATPAAATPAAPAAGATASAPAASRAAASVATAAPGGPAAAPGAAAAAAAPAAAAAAPAAAAATATGSAAATDVVPTPAGPAVAAPDAALVSVGGLLPASSSPDSLLPGLTLGAGLALVLLSLGAFLKSSRSSRSDAPLAG